MLDTQLSILIPSLPERTALLSAQLARLSAQMRPGVEIIVNIDARDITLGAKENRLLRSARGKYVVFVDDDDAVRPNYLEKIFEGIEKDVDIVQIQTDYYVNDDWMALITFKLEQAPFWWQSASSTLYLRSCAKFCPHKRDIALQVMFEDINSIEDQNYARGLDKLCKTEHLIDTPVYEYRFDNRK